MTTKKHSKQVRRRAFAIWQKLGYLPWRKPRKERKAKEGKAGGDFYRGAFDSIPFLNNDAKRTFTHLLLRPGYMIRDYLSGQHERYLAPLTALIIFYAFFALVSAILQPVQQKNADPFDLDAIVAENADVQQELGQQFLQNTLLIVRKGYILLHLDQYPDEVDTQQESALAALEGTLRSQGIPLFIGEFFLLWFAMSISLRKQGMRMSACAAATAYVLCQFSFFMLFAVLLTWGKSKSLGGLLMLFLMSVDYYQLLNVKIGRSIRLALRTGIWYIILYGLVILAISAVAMLLAWSKV